VISCALVSLSLVITPSDSTDPTYTEDSLIRHAQLCDEQNVKWFRSEGASSIRRQCETCRRTMTGKSLSGDCVHALTSVKPAAVPRTTNCWFGPLPPAARLRVNQPPLRFCMSTTQRYDTLNSHTVTVPTQSELLMTWLYIRGTKSRMQRTQLTLLL
jgi:hypothetical protein